MNLDKFALASLAIVALAALMTLQPGCALLTDAADENPECDLEFSLGDCGCGQACVANENGAGECMDGCRTDDDCSASCGTGSSQCYAGRCYECFPGSLRGDGANDRPPMCCSGFDGDECSSCRIETSLTGVCERNF